MRILTISSYYPPFELGGWEQLTQEINLLLAGRGHTTAVLTSRFRAKEVAEPEPGVYRWLKTDSDDLVHYRPSALFLKPWIEKENQRSLEKVIHQFKPDAILIHSMWNLSRAVAWHAERLLPGRVIYYMASDWPYRPDAHRAYWRASTRRAWMRGAKKILSAAPLYYLERERQQLQLKFEHVLCVSQAVREDLSRHAGVSFERSRVVYNGIDTSHFQPPQGWNPGTWKNRSPAFLFAGGLYPHKGPDIAIEGFARALRCPGMEGATLTIVGSGSPDYETRLKHLSEKGLNGQVSFLGRVDRRQMPDLLRQFDILLVPSRFEPLARIMQEGMASGLVVIGTDSFGSREILKSEENGLAFEPGDADGLAGQIARVVSDVELRRRITRAGMRTVTEHFNIDRMILEIEQFLLQVCSAEPAGA